MHWKVLFDELYEVAFTHLLLPTLLAQFCLQIGLMTFNWPLLVPYYAMLALLLLTYYPMNALRFIKVGTEL